VTESLERAQRNSYACFDYFNFMKSEEVSEEVIECGAQRTQKIE